MSDIMSFGYSLSEWQDIRSTIPALADAEDITLSIDSSHINPDHRFTLRWWLEMLANVYLQNSGIHEKTTHVSARVEHKLLRDVSEKAAALLEAIAEAERANCVYTFLAEPASLGSGRNHRVSEKAHGQSIVAVQDIERNASSWASKLRESPAWDVGGKKNASDFITNHYLSDVLLLWMNIIKEQNKIAKTEAARFLMAVANPVLKKRKRTKAMGAMREWITRELEKPTINRT